MKDCPKKVESCGGYLTLCCLLSRSGYRALIRQSVLVYPATRGNRLNHCVIRKEYVLSAMNIHVKQLCACLRKDIRGSEKRPVEFSVF
jgi:hypothetical protein